MIVPLTDWMQLMVDPGHIDIFFFLFSVLGWIEDQTWCLYTWVCVYATLESLVGGWWWQFCSGRSSRVLRNSLQPTIQVVHLHLFLVGLGFRVLNLLILLKVFYRRNVIFQGGETYFWVFPFRPGCKGRRLWRCNKAGRDCTQHAG